MNKKRIEIGMVAKRSLPIFVFTTFLFVLADSAFATGADEKSTITDNKVKKSNNSNLFQFVNFRFQCNIQFFFTYNRNCLRFHS